jgi:hypothetical protein
MREIIKKILLEQSWFDEDKVPIKGKASERVFKFLDKIGLEEGIPLLHLDDYEKEVEVVMSYYQDYGGQWSVDIPVTFTASQVASLFDDRAYGLENIVEKYLENNYDYDGHYDCYDYDHNWMWGDIDEENKKEMLGKAKKAGIDMGDEDYVIGFIEEEFGSDIGCAWADAQHDADVNELHSDIDSNIEDLFTEFDGKWDFEKGEFNGTIPFVNLVSSEYFRDAVDSNLLNADELDPYWILESVIENEWDDVRYGSTTTLFPHKVYINTDKHFRYGGAGDMDKSHMNEILSDRLYWD